MSPLFAVPFVSSKVTRVGSVIPSILTGLEETRLFLSTPADGRNSATVGGVVTDGRVFTFQNRSMPPTVILTVFSASNSAGEVSLT